MPFITKLGVVVTERATASTESDRLEAAAAERWRWARIARDMKESSRKIAVPVTSERVSFS